MFLSDFVCLFVCLCVSKITRKVMDGSLILRVCRAWHKLPVTQFWAWSSRNPVFQITLNFHYHFVKGGIREPLAKRRWWCHLANSFALAEVPAGYDCFSSCNCNFSHILSTKRLRNMQLLGNIKTFKAFLFAEYYKASWVSCFVFKSNNYDDDDDDEGW